MLLLSFRFQKYYYFLGLFWEYVVGKTNISKALQGHLPVWDFYKKRPFIFVISLSSYPTETTIYGPFDGFIFTKVLDRAYSPI